MFTFIFGIYKNKESCIEAFRRKQFLKRELKEVNMKNEFKNIINDMYYEMDECEEMITKFINVLVLLTLTYIMTSIVLFIPILIPDSFLEINFNYLKSSGMLQCILLIISSFSMSIFYKYALKNPKLENRLSKKEISSTIEMGVIIFGINILFFITAGTEVKTLTILMIIVLLLGKHFWIDFAFYCKKICNFNLIVFLKNNKIILLGGLFFLITSASISSIGGINILAIYLGMMISFLFYRIFFKMINLILEKKF